MKRLVVFIFAIMLSFSTVNAQETQQGQQQANPTVGNAVAASAEDIVVPEGYSVEVAAADLSYPGDMTFGPDGEMYIAEVGGHTYGTKPEEAPQARILRINTDGTREVVYDKVVPLEVIQQVEFGEAIPEEGLVPPITGLTYNPNSGLLYVSHRTRYSTLNPETGEFNTIIDGLPVWGEFLNHKPIFGPDGKMYFVLSTQGNSGTVDGHMTKVMKIFNKPNAREIPCQDVEVTGADFWIDNPLTERKEKVRAEVYVELGVNTTYGQVIPGEFWCHGAVYRTDADGSNAERLAWGLRSLYGYDFAPNGRLYATQNSGNIMAPRPIYDDWETIYEIREGGWYGWPDYYSGIPITDDRFRRPNDPEFTGQPFPHEFSLTEETRRRLAGDDLLPIQPVIRLPVHAAAEGLAFSPEGFGLEPYEVLVAEFGAIIPYYKEPDAWPGFRVQKVDLITSEIENFAYNRSLKPAWATGGGGLRRPLQVTFGPDGALYITDFGVIHFSEQGMNAQPNTGVIWKVSLTGQAAGQTSQQAMPQAAVRNVQQVLTQGIATVPTPQVAEAFRNLRTNLQNDGDLQVVAVAIEPVEQALTAEPFDQAALVNALQELALQMRVVADAGDQALTVELASLVDQTANFIQNEGFTPRMEVDTP